MAQARNLYPRPEMLDLSAAQCAYYLVRVHRYSMKELQQYTLSQLQSMVYHCRMKRYRAIRDDKMPIGAN